MTRPLRLTGSAILIVGILLWRAYQRTEVAVGPAEVSETRSAAVDNVTRAYRAELRDVPVSGYGVVTRLMADDRDGARHQRFLLGTPGGTTVLVAHNLDLAPRLAPLAVGDTVQFTGEYVWNDRGGVLHWTHHDPDRRHPAGHLTAHGRTVD